MLEFIIIAALIGVVYFSLRGGLKMHYNGALGAVMSSSKSKGGVMVAVAAITLLLLWYFWSNLVSLHNSLVGPSFPMWGYAAILAGLIIAIWIFRMDKEKRAKTSNLAEWLIGFAAIGGAIVIFNSWQKEDALCPDKQSTISVPATGMVVDLHACWDEEFVTLDLREVGVTKLSFNEESAVLQGRTIREFARIQTGIPGSLDGDGRLVFNAAEMRRYGMTTLSVFVGPHEHQPGSVPRFTEADIQALSQ